MEDILRIINSDPELKAKFETAVDNYCNSREGQLVLTWETKKHNLTGDQMEALTFALEWADAHPNWISVEDEQPPTNDKDDESEDYLIVDEDGDMTVGYYNKKDKLWFSSDGYILGTTHWMPLPTPPKKGGEE